MLDMTWRNLVIGLTPKKSVTRAIRPRTFMGKVAHSRECINVTCYSLSWERIANAARKGTKHKF
jgi:hypothetical protein